MNFRAKLGHLFFASRTFLSLWIIPVFYFFHDDKAIKLWCVFAGGAFIILGELIRIWGVSYAGSITRTRIVSLDRLVTNGPFAYVRNPLYVGNLLLWTGFTFLSGLLWFIPLIWLWFSTQYYFIIRWEELKLEEEFGEEYRAYKENTPRWIPSFRPHPIRSDHEHDLKHALRSERGTFSTIIILILALTVNRSTINTSILFFFNYGWDLKIENFVEQAFRIMILGVVFQYLALWFEARLYVQSSPIRRTRRREVEIAGLGRFFSAVCMFDATVLIVGSLMTSINHSLMERLMSNIMLASQGYVLISASRFDRLHSKYRVELVAFLVVTLMVLVVFRNW